MFEAIDLCCCVRLIDCLFIILYCWKLGGPKNTENLQYSLHRCIHKRLCAHLSTHFLYLGISLAYNSLLDGDSLPSLCSLSEQLSMNIWATTDRQASTMLDLCMSNTKSGFLITFTQNLSGKLQKNQTQWVINQITMKMKNAIDTQDLTVHVTTMVLLH